MVQNFGIFVNMQLNEVKPDFWYYSANGFGQVYFKTQQDAENAINAVGASEILKAAKWLAQGVIGE